MLDPDEEYERSSRRGSFAAKVVKKKRGSLNEDLLDDQDENYDYDFDNEHFRQGSIYTKRDEKDGTENNDVYTTGIQSRDQDSKRLRSTSQAQGFDNSMPNKGLLDPTRQTANYG
jgi:hypothetical protein